MTIVTFDLSNPEKARDGLKKLLKVLNRKISADRALVTLNMRGQDRRKKAARKRPQVIHKESTIKR